MPRRVRHDELAPRRGHVAVRDINGDTLLAFGPQSIGEIGKVHLPATSDVRRALQRLHLVLHDGLGIKKQPPNQRTLAIIH